MAREFTEADLFAECERRLRTVSFTLLPVPCAFAATWRALQAWLTHQMADAKGASLPLLGKWLLKAVKQPGGSVVLHPCFVIAETYIRGCSMTAGQGVLRQASVSSSDQVRPCEEVNFTKLALRFGDGSLDKDTAALCTKHLVAAMGDSMKAGLACHFDFGVGVLSSADHRLEFSWAPDCVCRPAPAVAAALAAGATRPSSASASRPASAAFPPQRVATTSRLPTRPGTAGKQAVPVAASAAAAASGRAQQKAMQPAAPTLNSADSTAANQGAKGRTAKASVPVPSVRFQPQQEDTAIQTCRDVAVDTRFFTPIGANAFYVGFPSQGKGGHVVSGPQHAAVQQQAWERAELAAREEAVQDIKFEMKIEEDMQRRREDGRRYWQQRREQQEAYRVELEAQRQEKLQQLQERVWRQIEEADEDRAATSLAIGGGQGAARQARSAQGPNAAPWPAAPTRQQAPVQYKLRGAGGQQLSAEELMAALLEERQAEQEMVASYLKAQALAEERRQDDLADAQRRAAYRLAGRRY